MEYPACPKCQSNFTYALDELLICPHCFHEWKAEQTELTEIEQVDSVLDAYGNPLQNGDNVMIIKDLPVKGASKTLKSGTKVKNIKLVDEEHNISCKIEGFGAMGLKSEFVKKI